MEGISADDQGQDKYVSTLPAEHVISNMFIDRIDFEFQNRPMYLWKSINILNQHFGLDTVSLDRLRKTHIGKIDEIHRISAISDAHIYKLEDCQSTIVAILIANNIPVIMERIENADDTDHFYALFYKFARKANDTKVGKQSAKNDPEFVYLAYNIFNDVNVLKALSKHKVDNNQTDLSSDLFDAKGKRRYDEKLKTEYSKGIENTSQYDVKFEVVKNYYQHIFINNLYVLVPRIHTIDSIKQMLETGLGNRDFSYKLPKITKVL
jgi:hypothetical protein